MDKHILLLDPTVKCEIKIADISAVKYSETKNEIKLTLPADKCHIETLSRQSEPLSILEEVQTEEE